MRPYAERRAARIARLRERAIKKSAESDAAWKRMDNIAAIIPLGQPILVGHHSERRHRRDIKRIDQSMRKSVEASHEAAELERRAEAAEANTAVSSDDPEAIDKLRAKLAETERRHAVTLEANKRLRAGATRDEVAGLFDWWPNPERTLEIWMSMGRRTVSTTNSSAEIRRLKTRIEQVEQTASAPAREHTAGDIRIIEGENRVRVFFPGKPEDEVRARLKSRGFRWAPSEGAWQRLANNAAWHAALEVVEFANRRAP